MSEFGSIDDYIRQLTGITTYDVKDAANDGRHFRYALYE